MNPRAGVSVGTPYDLKALTNAKARLRGVRPRLSTEQAYRRELRRLLVELAAEVKVALQSYGRERQARLTQDDDGGFFSNFKVRLDYLVAQAHARIMRLLRSEAERHNTVWTARVQAQVNVDLSAVVTAEDLNAYMAVVSQRSLELIRDVPEKAIKDLDREFRNAVLQGKSTSELRALVRDKLNVSKRRAALIARDQTATLVSELNRARQLQAGITQFEWSTSRDERVRKEHERLHGRRFRWDKPPAEGFPGEPINCRCVALAVLE